MNPCIDMLVEMLEMLELSGFFHARGFCLGYVMMWTK